MSRYTHINGVFGFDADSNLRDRQQFSVEERDELIRAAAAKDDERIALIASHKHVQGLALEESHIPQAMQALLAERPDTREANLALTKLQLRESVTPDLFIINTSNAIEEMDKVTNTLAKRLREWYALYDPELEHAYKDHRAFIEAVISRTTDRSADTMGGMLADEDLNTIVAEAKSVDELYIRRDRLVEYLEIIMDRYTPNLKRVASPTIGAKLLSMAGSLHRLSRMPSSTIQLLGAETALFRHLRNNKARPPKHGVIFNHILLQRAPKPNRGKVARTLADKISIAVKVDYFKGEYIGEALYAQVEAKAKEEVVFRK